MRPRGRCRSPPRRGGLYLGLRVDPPAQACWFGLPQVRSFGIHAVSLWPRFSSLTKDIHGEAASARLEKQGPWSALRACPAGSGAPRNRRASDIPSRLRNEASKHRLRTSLHGSVSNCAQNCTRRFRKPCRAAPPGRQPQYRAGRHRHADGSLPHLAFNASESHVRVPLRQR